MFLVVFYIAILQLLTHASRVLPLRDIFSMLLVVRIAA